MKKYRVFEILRSERSGFWGYYVYSITLHGEVIRREFVGEFPTEGAVRLDAEIYRRCLDKAFLKC